MIFTKYVNTAALVYSKINVEERERDRRMKSRLLRTVGASTGMELRNDTNLVPWVDVITVKV
jgi:hypothetical protein